MRKGGRVGALRRLGACLVVAAACAVPSAASAQVEVAGGVGRYFLDIDVLPDAGDGWGYDGALRVGLADRFRIGGGVQYNRHGVGSGSDRYEVVVPFVQATFTVPTGARWEPFLTGRIGAVRHTLHVFGQEVTGTGRVIGGIAGVAVRFVSPLALELSGSLHHATVEDLEVELGGFPVSTEDLSARALGLRVGVAWSPWR